MLMTTIYIFLLAMGKSVEKPNSRDCVSNTLDNYDRKGSKPIVIATSN